MTQLPKQKSYKNLKNQKSLLLEFQQNNQPQMINIQKISQKLKILYQISIFSRGQSYRQIYNYTNMKNNKMNRISLYMPIQDRQQYQPRFISNFSALPYSFHRKNIRHSHSLNSCQLTDSVRTNRKYETCLKLQKRPLIQMSVHKMKKNSQSASVIHKTRKKRSSIKIRTEQSNISQPSLLITKLQKSVRTQRVKTQTRNLTEMELYRNYQIKNQSNKYQSTDESGIRNFSKGLNSNEKQIRTMRNLHIPLSKQKHYSRKANIKLSNIKIDQLLNIYLNRMQDNQTHK